MSHWRSACQSQSHWQDGSTVFRLELEYDGTRAKKSMTHTVRNDHFFTDILTFFDVHSPGHSELGGKGNVLIRPYSPNAQNHNTPLLLHSVHRLIYL